jgi:hypothetical protein
VSAPAALVASDAEELLEGLERRVRAVEELFEEHVRAERGEGGR